jgi:uncharacterized hydrophobic protein (TIGR00271 family)
MSQTDDAQTPAVETGHEAPPTSAQGDPWWLNPATIKGAALTFVGLAILAAPGISVELLRYILAAGLIVSGASDVWFRRKKTEGGRDRYGIASGLLMIAVGVALLAWPTAIKDTLLAILAVFLAFEGVLTLLRANAARNRGEDYAYRIVRGVLFVVAAVVIAIIGEAVFAFLVITGATASIIVGLVMVAYGLQQHTGEEKKDLDTAHVAGILRDWLEDRDVGPERRTQVVDGLYYEAPDRTAKITSYVVMLLLSVAIASFAILADSTAVVIGAMLVAPLMTPIMGAAAAVVNGWRARLMASLGTVALSVIGAVALAWIIAAWFPALVPLSTNSQVTSRVSPTMLDMAIALAAGAAGAYATIDDRVSSSLTGVAIAVALVPPLGVIGITLEASLYDDALGAFVLFLTNFVSIILAAVAVFLLVGLAPVRKMIERRSEIRSVLGTVAIGALIIIVPLTFTGNGVLASSSRQASAQSAVEDWLGEDDSLRLAQVETSGTEVSILITGAGKIPPVEDLEDDIAAAFGEPVTLTVEYVPSVVITYSDVTGKNEIDPTTVDDG